MSVKVPRGGTRGTPFPRFLTAFAKRFVRRQFRRGRARIQGGLPTLMLETVGAGPGRFVKRCYIDTLFEIRVSEWAPAEERRWPRPLR